MTKLASISNCVFARACCTAKNDESLQWYVMRQTTTNERKIEVSQNMDTNIECT